MNQSVRKSSTLDSSLSPSINFSKFHTSLLSPMRSTSLPTILPKRNEKTSSVDKSTAGPDWFYLPRTQPTPELIRDFRILLMRDCLDPKRHYRKETISTSASSILPSFSQVGQVIEGPTEYFSSRLPKRARQPSLFHDVLSTERLNGRFKRKYAELQKSRQALARRAPRPPRKSRR